MDFDFFRSEEAGDKGGMEGGEVPAGQENTGKAWRGIGVELAVEWLNCT